MPKRQTFSVVISAEEDFEEIWSIEIATAIEACCLAPETASIEVQSLLNEEGTDEG